MPPVLQSVNFSKPVSQNIHLLNDERTSYVKFSKLVMKYSLA